VRPYLRKSLHKKELVEWLKMKTLTSSSSATEKNDFFPATLLRSFQNYAAF
jgi:hypothetical protein